MSDDISIMSLLENKVDISGSGITDISGSGSSDINNSSDISGISSINDSSGNLCVVCLLDCSESSIHLFLYNCECVYPVHDECFKTWRRICGSNVICMMCREELEEADDWNPPRLPPPPRQIQIYRDPPREQHPTLEKIPFYFIVAITFIFTHFVLYRFLDSILH